MENHIWSNAWESLFKTTAWGKWPGEPLIRFVAKNFFYVEDRSMVRILELGCGPGPNLWFLAREGFSFTGIEGSPHAVSQARARLHEECPGWESRGALKVGDVTTMDFGEQVFDAVIDNECVYCMSFDKSRAIYAKAKKSLKSGGKIFVRTFATGSWGDETGIRVGHNAWICAEGPCAKKGPSRFTDLHEIPVLLEGFENLTIDQLTWTQNERKNEIKEWIITGTKFAS